MAEYGLDWQCNDGIVPDYVTDTQHQICEVRQPFIFAKRVHKGLLELRYYVDHNQWKHDQ